MTPPIRRCFVCSDTGLMFRDLEGVSACWRLRAGAEHNAASPAAELLARAVRTARIKKHDIDRHTFDVAVTLCRFSTEKPCKRDRLIELHFRHTRDPKRAVASTVETLRRDWLLPVAARKAEPSGYWIAASQDEFAEYVDLCRSAPITQLTTLYRTAKANWPVYAEQLELEFWNDLTAEKPEQLKEAA